MKFHYMAKNGGGSGRSSSAAAGGAVAVKTTVDFNPGKGDLNRYANAIGISKQEASERFYAIYAYTGSYHNQVRQDEKNGVNNPTVKRINDFLNSIPAYEGEIYRGFGTVGKAKWDKWYAKYITGDGFTKGLDAMSSFSRKKSVAKEFATSNYNALITVQNKSGKSIEKLSAHRSEAEVLVPKGTKYKIKSVQEKIDDLGRLNVNIVLEEV